MLRMGAGLVGAGLVAHGAATENPYTGAIGGAVAGAALWGPLAPVGLGIGLGVSAPERRDSDRNAFDYYRRMRKEGRSRVGATLSMFGAALAYPFTDTVEETQRNERANRRMVQIAGGGFEETGSAYERLTAAIEKQEGLSPAEEAAAATRDLTRATTELTDEMRRARGGELARPGAP